MTVFSKIICNSKIVDCYTNELQNCLKRKLEIANHELVIFVVHDFHMIRIVGQPKLHTLQKRQFTWCKLPSVTTVAYQYDCHTSQSNLWDSLMTDTCCISIDLFRCFLHKTFCKLFTLFQELPLSLLSLLYWLFKCFYVYMFLTLDCQVQRCNKNRTANLFKPQPTTLNALRKNTEEMFYAALVFRNSSSVRSILQPFL